MEKRNFIQETLWDEEKKEIYFSLSTWTVSAPKSKNSAAWYPFSTPPIPERVGLPSKSSLMSLEMAITLAKAMGLTAWLE